MSDQIETKPELGADPQGRLEEFVSGCDICRELRPLDELKHLPIYVYGSEGINLCDICQ